MKTMKAWSDYKKFGKFAYFAKLTSSIKYTYLDKICQTNGIKTSFLRRFAKLLSVTVSFNLSHSIGGGFYNFTAIANIKDIHAATSSNYN